MRPRDVALLFLAGAAFFLPALATRDVWQSLESRYSAIAREMALDGNWLVPRFDGEVYADKPPLFLWCGAALYRLGCGVQGMRVLGALAAALALVATAALGRLLLPRRTALLGAAVLATTPGFAWGGRFGEIDVPLTLLTTTAVYGWFAGGRRVALFYAFAGLAVLGKGPVGLAVPLLAVVAGRIAGVRPSSPRAPFHPVWGSLVALGVPALWLAAAVASVGSGYAHEMIFKHVLTRLANPWIHAHAPWYYVTEGARWLLPWLVVAVPAAARSWRLRREDPVPLMLVLWFVLGFLFLSALPAKRVPYLLPFAPPLALLVAGEIEALLTAGRHMLIRALHLGAIASGAGLLAFGLGAGEAILRGLGIAPYLVEALRPAARLPGGAVVAAGGAAMIALGVTGLVRCAARWILVAEVALGFAVADIALSPRLDAIRSPRAIAARVDDLVPPGTGEVATHPDGFLGLLHLYSDRRRFVVAGTVEEIRSFLLAPGGPRLVVTRELPPGLPGELVGRLGAREVFVLRPAR